MRLIAQPNRDADGWQPEQVCEEDVFDEASNERLESK